MNWSAPDGVDVTLRCSGSVTQFPLGKAVTTARPAADFDF